MNITHFIFITISISLTVFACKQEEIIVIEEEAPPEPTERVTGRCGGSYNYQTLIMKGTEFSEECSDHALTLVQGSTEIPLEMTYCNSEQVAAFIPHDIEPGDYQIELVLDGEPYIPSPEYENLFSVRSKRRPVIFELSKTTFTYRDTIIATGLYFFNDEGGAENEPEVRIYKDDFYDFDLPTEFNEEGTEVTIFIDTNFPFSDEYKLYIYNGEFGNKVSVTAN